jgi:hypothetical protein
LNKGLHKVFTALLALGFALISTPVPALSAESTVVLTVNPSSGQIGESVTVSGTGLYLGQTTMFRLYFTDQEVNLSQDYVYVEDTLTSYCYFPVTNIVGDSFTQTVAIPAYFNNKPVDKDGTYYFYLTKLNGMVNKYVILDGVPFAITGFSDVALAPVQGSSGQELEITGGGFWPGENIQILFDGIDITEEYVDGEPKAVSSGTEAGTFSVVVPVPAASYGEKVVKVIGESSGIEANRTFTVLPKITLTPAFGGGGSQVIVSGTGFSENADIYFEDVFIICAQATEGCFTQTINVPADLEFGTYTIRAEDPVTPDTINASASFEVIDPLVAPEPLEPANGKQDVPVHPTFAWAPVTVAESYEFQLSKDPGFDRDVLVAVSITDTTYSHSAPALDLDTYYYWRVRAVDEDETCGPWSLLRNIRTVAETTNPGEPAEPTDPTVTVTITNPPVTSTVTVTSPPLTVTQTQLPITVTKTSEVTHTTTAVVTTTAAGPTSHAQIQHVTHTTVVEQPPVTVTHTIEPVNRLRSGDRKPNGL